MLAISKPDMSNGETFDELVLIDELKYSCHVQRQFSQRMWHTLKFPLKSKLKQREYRKNTRNKLGGGKIKG